MSDICIITGGGSGMGLEAAKLVGKSSRIILVGRTVSKLENALTELKSLGIDAEAFPCDAGDRESVKKLAEYASSIGNIKSVIHAAGVSPHMGDGESIFRINAIGTINIDEELSKVMKEGSCILNVSSMAGHLFPLRPEFIPLYKLAFQSTDALMEGAKNMFVAMPAEQQSGVSYSLSKNFVLWYSRRMAVELGKNGIRVVSISPGTFTTPMGEIEGDEAASFARSGALGRCGNPVEIARMMAFIVSDDASYLTGTDVLYDGGVVAATLARAEDEPQ